MSTLKSIYLGLFLVASSIILAQDFKLQNEYFEIQCNKAGFIRSFQNNGKDIEFRQDKKYEGPSLVYDNQIVVVKSTKSSSKQLDFEGEMPKVAFTLSYSFDKKAFVIKATIKNKTSEVLPVDTFMLRLGINTEMDAFPHWKKVYFPTMMRCEKDFFWGYMMNPNGDIITIATKQPVASWNYSYNHGGHRIFGANLDLMHKLPLPERHPQYLHTLQPNEEKTWVISIQPTNKLEEVKPIISELSKAVIIDALQYTIAENEAFHVQLVGTVKSIQLITPNKRVLNFKSSKKLDFGPTDGVGKYKLVVVSKNGKTSEAVFSVRKPWSWYMQQARINAIEKEQKGGSHTESWYGLFSMFLTQKYFPDDALMKKSMDKFNEIYPLMYDELGNPKSILLWGSWDIRNRIQNTACMASVLADMFETLKDTSYLAKASTMCDFLLKNQDAKGAFRNGHTHYTSVIYIAKSVLEVSEQEKLLAHDNNIWQQRYERHFNAAKRAIDELTDSRDNIQTEGEMTYEDGMISCSYTQISLLATLTTDAQARTKYIEAAEYLRNGHRSLSQLLIPDSRMNGGSLRYWESQYDILSYQNIMSSPHGWTAWRIYGLYYLYELTGNPTLLDQIFNAMGTCVQLIDDKTGELRWAFCVDPYLEGNPALNNPTKKFSHDAMNGGNLLIKDSTTNIRENRGLRINKPIGEQYLPMISGWYKAKPNTWVTGYWEPDGGCCDNDVHEIFKCLEETVLTNAFVVELKDGTLKGYNCKVVRNGSAIDVKLNEEVIQNVHFNLNVDTKVSVYFKQTKIEANIRGHEMQWIRNTQL